MAKSRNIVIFRQWFACVYGYKFGEEALPNWQLPDNARNIYNRYVSQMGGSDPIKYGSIYEYLTTNKPDATSIVREVRADGCFDLYLTDYDMFSYLAEFDLVCKQEIVHVVRQIRAVASDSPNSPRVNAELAAVTGWDGELKITKVSDMDFPNLPLWRSGHALDMIFSDLTDLGGAYGGSVFICTGESGVGKSTLLQDYLMKIKEHEDKLLEAKIQTRMEDARFSGIKSATLKRWLSFVRTKYSFKPLYISSEMTKTDLWFYVQKMPSINDLPTLLVSDYLEGGLKQALEAAFNTKYDMILLDSYADTVEKLKDILGWTTSYAENFLTGIMIKAAEKQGKCIVAIQHMTKGGVYVGSTKLKHTTTGMMSIRFDQTGQRFVQFDKNRRGGSMTGKPLYFVLDKGTKELRYDVDKFEDAIQNAASAVDIQESVKVLDNKFDLIFEHMTNPDIKLEDIHDEQED